VKQKHAPDISRSCIGTAQLPVAGVALNTTGALVPKFNEHVVVRVNGPNTLLSPAVKVVVTVIVDTPPQHASANPVPGRLASTGIVALTRLQLTGVTFVNTIIESAIPSPFVSHVSVAAVVTVLPPRCSGTPVSDWNPWQIVVTSFGKNPHPTKLRFTEHNAFTTPVVVGVVTTVPCALPGDVAITVRQAGFAGGAQPIPKKHIRPRFRSRCRALVHSTASFPSNRRSKSGRANVISPPAPVFAVNPSLNNSKIVGSVPSPMQHAQLIAPISPWITPNAFTSAARAASDRLISHNPGGFNGLNPPIEYPVITGLKSVPSRSIRQ
jgi:hypothetical protein